MGFAMRAGLVAALLVIFLARCATLDETRETASTVDDAVSLMQAVDERGGAARASAAVDDLIAAGAGYEATVLVRQGRLNADGTADPAAASTWTYTLQVDAEGDLLAEYTGGDGTATVVVPGGEPPPAPVYRVAPDGTYCASDDPAAARLSAGLAGLIAGHDALTAGTRTLAVIAEPLEVTVASREATQYAFDSRVQDALRILDEYDDDALEQAIAAAETVAFAGHVVIDDETGALLRLFSTTLLHDESQWIEFSFDLTRWGDVPDVARPDAAHSAVPCG